MKHLVGLFLALLLPMASAQPASCAAEKGLAGRSDILHCEGWETSTWWQNGYKEDGEKTAPSAASGPDQTAVISTGCISGNCLKVNCLRWLDGGCSGMLAHHWPIPGTQQEIFLRYYLKLADGSEGGGISPWSPNFCDTSGGNCSNGGKFPGLADVRTNADPSGQCGNGGAFSDGINCWSGRLRYRDCLGSGDADICAAGGGTETTRLGWYWSVPPAGQENNQAFGAFDNLSWDGFAGNCASSPVNLGSNGSDSTSCGKGAGGLVNGQWYLVQEHIKMNTPGVADGVAEAMIARHSAGACTAASTAGCAVLKYRKTNMKFREVGHDNLHVRTVWLDVHSGGDVVGPTNTTAIYLDQLVVATKTWPGAFRSTGSYVSQPFNVN